MNRIIGNDSSQREGALARWDNEGGAGARRWQAHVPASTGASRLPQRRSVELDQLRIRVIALENLVITLLAESSERQLDLARSMATHVAPRPGFTHHRITLHAAAQMRHLIKRAGHFRGAALRIDDPPEPLATTASGHSER
jgi:hypothetical protein